MVKWPAAGGGPAEGGAGPINRGSTQNKTSHTVPAGAKGRSVPRFGLPQAGPASAMNIARRISSEKPAAGRMSALSMYEIPPTEPISVSEFEDFAFDRLRCALC